MELMYGAAKAEREMRLVKYHFNYPSNIHTVAKYPIPTLYKHPTEMFITRRGTVGDRLTLTGITSDDDRNGAAAFERGDTLELLLKWYTKSSGEQVVPLLDYVMEQDMIEVYSNLKYFALPVNVGVTLSDIIDVKKARVMVIGVRLKGIAGGGSVPNRPNEFALSFTYESDLN